MFTLFKPYLKPLLQYRALLFWGLFLYILAGAASIALLSLSGWFISAAAFAGMTSLGASQFNYLLPGAGVRLFSYMRIASRYGERLINHEAIFRFIANIRLWLFRHLALLSPEQLNFVDNADLLNRFISDIGFLDNLFLRIIAPIFNFMVLLVVSVIFLCFVNIKLSVIILIYTMFLVLFIAYIVLNKQAANYQEALNLLRHSTTQSIQALREITLFNAQKNQMERVDACAEQLSKNQHAINKKSAKAQAVIIEGIGLLVLLTVLITVQATLLKHLSGAYIALVFLGVFAFGEEIQNLIMAFLLIDQTKQAAKNINAMMSVKPQFQSPSYPVFSIDSKIFDLNISNLSFNYIGQINKLFDQFNMQITSKTHCVIMGESGHGKSTLVNLIARFIMPNSGTITINHHDIYQLTEEQWQSIFCIVPQRAFLFDTTLRENLILANPDATDEMCWHALDICQIKPFIAALPNGLDTYIGKNGEHLSGGQARRIVLARAILKNAPVTILDEPTDGLDQATEIALIKAFRIFFSEKTLIVISHRTAISDLFSTRFVV